MFDNCGSSIKCGFGSVGISGVSLLRRSRDTLPAYRIMETPEIISFTDFRLLRGISTTQTRDLSVIRYDRSAFVSISNESFAPEKITLQVNYFDNIDRLKRFVRQQNYFYTLKLETPSGAYFCDVQLESDTVSTYTIFDKLEFNFLRTSMFYKIVPLDVQEYPGPINIIATNYGDMPGALKLHRWLYNEVSAFLSINSDTFNTYYTVGSYAEVGVNYIHYSSVPGDLYISYEAEEQEPVDIAGKRDFSNKGFVTVPVGEFQLTASTSAWEVLMYEYYYNI